MNALISLEYFFGFEIYETTFTIFFIFISKSTFLLLFLHFLFNNFFVINQKQNNNENSIKKIQLSIRR